MNYLLITLGHNSSAIFVDNDQIDKKPVVIGYEQERFSKLKADSQFPIDAINEIIYNVGLKKLKQSKCLVSHWFNFNEGNMPNKYISYSDMMFLKDLTSQVEFVNNEFTHHDAHMMSAYTFYKYSIGKNDNYETPLHCLVIDGFGNNEEVISLYCRLNNDDKPKLIKRIYGYNYSLGLMYQYATSFVGMKENQDEYKFLGYEAHIDEYFNENCISAISQKSDELIEKVFKPAIFINDGASTIPTSAAVGIDFNRAKLNTVKSMWYSYFSDVLQCLGYHSESIEHTESFEARVAIAFYIQRTIEKVISLICVAYNIKNLCCAGGLFYNVKLNNHILNVISGNLCVMPLAGDQGAAIGMYANEPNTPQFPFNTLSIGPRRLYNIEKQIKNIPNAKILNESANSTYYEIAEEIANGNIVNIIFGNMEFGPRALCSTSTLFLPTERNTSRNNANNKRNEVMPCAPVCTDKNAKLLFNNYELDRIIGSTKFMICTCEYEKPYSKSYSGVMHKITLHDNSYSGRPQIISDSDNFYEERMYLLLGFVERITDYKCIVNTSFNAHGQPIVFDTADIIRNFMIQYENAKTGEKPKLYILI